MPLLYDALSGRILKCFHHTYNRIDYGYPEKVCGKCLLIDLRAEGLSVSVEPTIRVYYKGHDVGVYRPDFIIEGRIVLEIKALPTLIRANERQLYTYMKGSSCRVGLLLNFGEKPEFKRLYLTDREFQGSLSLTHQSA